MSRVYRNFFIFEIVVIFAVIMAFKLVSERIWAGAIAGTLFVVLGAWIVGSGIRERRVRASLTFVLGAVHLFVIALPMMITRFLNASLAFSEVQILGLPGPVFHQLSTAVYFALMAATLFDWYRFRRQ